MMKVIIGRKIPNILFAFFGDVNTQEQIDRLLFVAV